MITNSPVKVLPHKIAFTLVVALSFGLIPVAQPAVKSQTVTSSRRASEQTTAAYFESIRKSPPKQLAFLLKMPKGADLRRALHRVGGRKRFMR
jgi:hypothetical protein